MLNIRRIKKQDWPRIWQMILPVFRAGDTYAISPEINEQEAHALWVEKPAATFVVEDKSGILLGTYYLKPNQAGPGNHICNCGYIVATAARGKGVASAMCEHSQQEAVVQGFRAMQYNLVVSSNSGAVRLWQKHGFEIVGTLPKAFRHPQLGFVDAFVMYKMLTLKSFSLAVFLCL